MNRITVACFLAMGSLAITASATVRVFATSSSDPYGCNSANAFQPTFSVVYPNAGTYNAYDYSDVNGVPNNLWAPATFPPANTPSGTLSNPIAINPGAYAYIWLQFQGEAPGRMVAGLTVQIDEVGGPAPAPPANIAWYLMNNLQGLPAFCRWDGTATPPVYPEWRNNPQTMVAVTSSGISNLATDVPWNLYEGASGIALLGAVLYPSAGSTYYVNITNISLRGQSDVAGGYFQFVPEPGGLLLMGLAGLLLRRR